MKMTITAQEMTPLYFSLYDIMELQKMPHKTLNMILHVILKWDLSVKSQSLDTFRRFF